MAIAAMVLWLLTAAAGLTLLNTGGAARRAAARSARLAARERARTGPVVLPVGPDGKPVRPPSARVTAPPGERPLLEFSHPALALAGSACWLMYVLTGYPVMAWTSLAILAVTIGLGLAWVIRTRRAAARPAGTSWAFPPRLIALHGAAVAVAVTLSLLTALVAART